MSLPSAYQSWLEDQHELEEQRREEQDKRAEEAVRTLREKVGNHQFTRDTLNIVANSLGGK